MVSHDDLLMSMTVLIVGWAVVETALIVWAVRSVNRVIRHLGKD